MYNFGKIVLIPFPFTDLSGSKVRPAVIVSSKAIGDDIVVVFVSTNIVKKGRFGVFIKKSAKNGLRSDSVVVISKIATLAKKTILGEIGELSKNDISQIRNKIKNLFL